MSIKISCALNTWRLGALDSVITSLEAQQGIDFSEVEMVIADELHRWREPLMRKRLQACPFAVKHLPVERSLFPVCSTMRAGNTCIRNSDPLSQLLVHVCDGAVLPPNFLAEHWLAYQRDPKAIGIAPYRGRTVKPEAWAMPVMGAWEMIERLVSDYARGVVSDVAWTGLLGRTEFYRDPIDINSICVPLDSINPQGGSPALVETGTQPGDVVTEWFAHYKVDAVPLDAYRAVNGWDEEYDGGYIYADIDMSLRLAAAGYQPRAIGYGSPVEVPILDFHLVTKRTEDVAYRQWWMVARLFGTQKRLEKDITEFRCVEGLDRPIHSHENDGKTLAKQGETHRLTIVRPWLIPRFEGGRLDIVVSLEAAFIWSHIAPPILYGWSPIERLLGDEAVSGLGPWGSMVTHSGPQAGSSLGKIRIIFTGSEEAANEWIDYANENGYPCEARQIKDDICGVVVAKP